MYRHSIILLKDQNLARIARTVLEYRDRHAEKDLALLRDLNEITADILRTGNTSNIRRQLGTFIMQKGFPFLTMIDFRTDLGLSKEQDPDNLKLFRTLIISFVLLAHTKGYENKTTNLILLTAGEDTTQVRKWIAEPALLFSAVKTSDDKLNAYISAFASNEEKARSYFHLVALEYPAAGQLPQSIKKFEEAVDEIQKWLVEKKHVNKNHTGLVTEDLPPANAVLRVNPEKLVADGILRDANNDEKLSYTEMTLYLLGAVTIGTFETVKKRIIQTINAAHRIKPFRKDTRLVIKVPDASVIDASFATNFGMFFSNLPISINAVLDLGRNNLEKVKTATGFIAVKAHMINRY
jgi:hypothetical protein